MDSSMDNRYFCLVNLYAPTIPKERAVLFNNLDVFLSCKYDLIVAGDFNFVFDNRLDKIGGSISATSGSRSFSTIIKSLSLIDAFRYKYPDRGVVTWSNKEMGSRIDRFYVS